MAERAERAIEGRAVSSARLRLLGTLLLVGLPPGAVGGLAAFVAVKDTLVPWAIPQWGAIGIVVLMGMYVHLFAGGLTTSVGGALAATAASLATHVGAWIAPLWLLGYPPGARDLLLPRFAGQAVVAWVFVFPAAFAAGYFTTVVIAGYLNP